MGFLTICISGNLWSSELDITMWMGLHWLERLSTLTSGTGHFIIFYLELSSWIIIVDSQHYSHGQSQGKIFWLRVLISFWWEGRPPPLNSNTDVLIKMLCLTVDTQVAFSRGGQGHHQLYQIHQNHPWYINATIWEILQNIINIREVCKKKLSLLVEFWH